MHQIAPNCVANFKIFPGGITTDPLSWGGGHPFTAPRGICAVLNNPLKIPNFGLTVRFKLQRATAASLLTYGRTEGRHTD